MSKKVEPLELISYYELMNRQYEPTPEPGEVPHYSLNEIIDLEPRIGEILHKMKPAKRGLGRCRRYISLKKELSTLVGWSAEKYLLRTSQAYDVVLDYVIEKLNL